MELKSDLEQWRDGCVAFDKKEYDAALRTFMRIGDNARMHFNIGLIFIILEDHRRSLAAFKKSLEMDPFFAVACFQRGVSYFSLGDVAKAYEDFDLAYQKLRGNAIINYHQLGLSFRLYECEVLFNRGICQLYLGKIDAGLTDLYYAQKNKVTNEHDIIDEAVRERGRNYSVYSIPQGVLFRPSETKMERLRRYQEFHGDTTYVEEEPKRQNSVLLPPSAPWMQQIKTTTDAYLVVPRPHRPQAPLNLLDEQQQSPIPEAPDARTRDTQPKDGDGWTDQMDPFMREPAIELPPETHEPALPELREPGGKQYNPESWKFVDRRSKKDAGRFGSDNQPDQTSSNAVQDNQADYTGTLDTMSYFGDSLDDELDKVYVSLNQYLSTNNNTKPAKEVTTRSAIYKNNPVAPPKSSPDAKIKIKVHYHDTRILLVPSTIMFGELLTRVRAKFNAYETLRLQYKDEEGVLVLMIDQDDLNMARQLSLARNTIKHPALEKLELWCVSSSS